MTRRQWLGFAALSAACVFSAVYGFVWWAAGKITRQPRIGGPMPKLGYPGDDYECKLPTAAEFAARADWDHLERIVAEDRIQRFPTEPMTVLYDYIKNQPRSAP